MRNRVVIFLLCFLLSACGVASQTPVASSPSPIVSSPEPSATWTPSPTETLTPIPTATRTVFQPCTQDLDGGTVELWKCPFQRREDFMVGGVGLGYIAKRDWGPHYWQETNPLEVLKANGMEWVHVGTLMRSISRLRGNNEAWKYMNWQDGFGDCHEYSAQILKEAQDFGFRSILTYDLMTDYTESFNDAPLDWQGLSLEDTAEKLENYTYKTTKYFMGQGLNIEMYEVGGEADFGVLGFLPGKRIYMPPGVDTRFNTTYMRQAVWPGEALLLKRGIEGVKRANPDATIALYASNINTWDNDNIIQKGFFQFMKEQHVPFDYGCVSLSYPEPNWFPSRITTEQFFAKLQDFIDFMDKLDIPVVVCETAYPHKPFDENYPAFDNIKPMKGYPFSEEGQAAWVRDMLRFFSNNLNVHGFYYWAPDMYDGKESGALPGDVGLFITDMQPAQAMSEFQVNLNK